VFPLIDFSIGTPQATNLLYSSSPENDISPQYESATSISNRSDARGHSALPEEYPEDQRAVIEFLKQL
jgi:hypothetical protein